MANKTKLSAFAKKKLIMKRLSMVGAIFTWTISLFLCTFCLSNLYQKYINKNEYVGFFGIGNAIVVSESMTPNLNVNDFVVYKDVKEPSSLSRGDIVLYSKSYGPGQDDILIIHRLEGIVDGYAVTKGDANNVSDEPFEVSRIVGKFLFAIPGLGSVFNAFSTYYAIALFVLILALGVLMRLITDWIKKQYMLSKVATSKDEKKAIQQFLSI